MTATDLLSVSGLHARFDTEGGRDVVEAALAHVVAGEWTAAAVTLRK